MSTTNLQLLAFLSGLLISLNPTTLSAFTGLLLGSIGKGHKKSEQSLVAISFLVVLFCLYSLVGLVALNLLNLLEAQTISNVAIFLAIIGIIWGILLIKEYYWYGHHRYLSFRLAHRLHNRTTKKSDPASAMLASMTTAYITVPSVGIPLIIIATICTVLPDPSQATRMIAFFVLALLLPLIAIYIASLSGLKLSAIVRWKEDSKGSFRLVMGLSTIILAWILLLLLNGVIEL